MFKFLFNLKRFLSSFFVLAVFSSAAQTFPDRPIKLVVPAAAGGPTDVLARFVADGLQKSLGQPAIIDNRSGAGGVIGARFVASSAADGYTLLFGNTATIATIPATSKSAGYDPRRNLVAVAKVIDSYQVVVVRPDLPIKSVSDLLTYARAHPGKMNFGAVGPGNLTHLSGELLKSRTGIEFTTVHYKSGAESLNAIIGGQIDFAIDNIGAVRNLVNAGRLRAIAVTSVGRKPEFSDLPTMAEAGVPNFVVTSFFGIMAPADTPNAIVSKLNLAINEGLKTPAFQSTLLQLGAQAAPDTSDRFRQLIDEEIRKWTELARSSNIDVN
jgi:tripartite-type tricarboxylate transporter receptor subunit TctC